MYLDASHQCMSKNITCITRTHKKREIKSNAYCTMNNCKSARWLSLQEVTYYINLSYQMMLIQLLKVSSVCNTHTINCHQQLKKIKPNEHIVENKLALIQDENVQKSLERKAKRALCVPSLDFE